MQADKFSGRSGVSVKVRQISWKNPERSMMQNLPTSLDTARTWGRARLALTPATEHQAPQRHMVPQKKRDSNPHWGYCAGTEVFQTFILTKVLMYVVFCFVFVLSSLHNLNRNTFLRGRRVWQKTAARSMQLIDFGNAGSHLYSGWSQKSGMEGENSSTAGQLCTNSTQILDEWGTQDVTCRSRSPSWQWARWDLLKASGVAE